MDYMKKPLPGQEGVISWRFLRQLVHFDSHAALLAGSGVLVQKTLLHSLIHRLDSVLERSVGLGAVATGDSSVELLDDRLELGLLSLVAGVGSLGQLDSLLCRLNIGHGIHLLQCYSYPLFLEKQRIRLMQKCIIAERRHKINSFFRKKQFFSEIFCTRPKKPSCFVEFGVRFPGKKSFSGDFKAEKRLRGTRNQAQQFDYVNLNKCIG